ncbi:MAG: biotin--[acetyl-CoA-carboxylase] ligase [Dorea sp.]|nr:biotin--[acetyl-CoA-carboxylase] ligase [Dorea sp.]
MKTAILRLLKEDDSYISGQQLCDRFQVSRTAVWKAVEQLKKEGYMIEAVRNKGYRLVDSPDVMSKAEIESMVRTKWAGRSVIYYDETDSTNIQAKLAGENGSEHGTLVVADRQVAGKGRRGRSWESPKGVCVYMTLLLRPSIAPVKAPMLTLVMALSVAEAVRELTGLKAGIKWPNDIVLNKKKICGILTEMSTEIDYINYVVTGVGINTNQETFSEEIRKRATSLLIEGGRHISRSELVAAVMERYEENYERFMETKDLSGLQEKYNGMLVNCGREVRVLEPKGEYSAFASGINEVGELVVTTPEGEEKHIFAGEVSVRGIYGYV